jgi:hypothetical protein
LVETAFFTSLPVDLGRNLILQRQPLMTAFHYAE